MNRILMLAALMLLASGVGAASWPYDEKADAPAQVQQALGAAYADHKQVLLVFGANWCEDCRALDKALQGSSHTLIEGKLTSSRSTSATSTRTWSSMRVTATRSRTASQPWWFWTPTTS
jgi:thiol-disulfide isomerase/thioredoxin